MAVCYGCLQPFDEAALPQPVRTYPVVSEDEELLIEEPSDTLLGASSETPQGFPQGSPSGSPSVRFHVTVSDLFGYDIYLSRVEGAQLTIGCARDNNIVLPHTESRRHLLKLYYAQGQVWAQDRGSTQQALIEGVPLTGTRNLKQEAVLEVGEARIELVED
jgi:hypothetical protein